MAITVAQAREILGPAAEGLTRGDLVGLLDRAYLFADVVVERLTDVEATEDQPRTRAL